MEMETIFTAVTNVGFPIVCSVIMFRLNDKMQKTLADLASTLVLMSERIKDVEEELKKGDN